MVLARKRRSVASVLMALAVPVAVPVAVHAVTVSEQTVSVVPDAGVPGTPVTVAVNGFGACVPAKAEPPPPPQEEYVPPPQEGSDSPPTVASGALMPRLSARQQGVAPVLGASTYDGPTNYPPDTSTQTPDPTVELAWSQGESMPVSVIPTDNGSAKTSLTVPETADPGELVLTATCVTDGKMTASTIFVVESPGSEPPPNPVPTVTLDPSTGSHGTSVEALATGFDGCGPGPQDDVGAGSVEFVLADAGIPLGVEELQRGSAASSFTVPESAPVGDTTLTVVCTTDDTVSARTTFTVEAPQVSPVQVPKLIGRTVDEAAADLVTVDLVLGRVGGDGAVIASQDPQAGASVPVGSSVDVTLRPPHPVPATVPDLVGLAASQVRAVLKSRGLVLGKRSGDGDTVRSQAPPAGSRVPLGTAVDISVEGSEPPPSWVEVPDVTGMTLDDATNALESVGLAPGGDVAPDGRVSDQRPTPGTLVLAGAVVELAESPPTPTWLLFVALLGLAVVAGLLAHQGTHARRDRRWLRRHTRLEPQPARPRYSVREPPTRSSAATTIVRLEPRLGRTAEHVEEVSR